MANYVIEKDGSWSQKGKKKKEKGTNYIIDNSGNWVSNDVTVEPTVNVETEKPKTTTKKEISKERQEELQKGFLEQRMDENIWGAKKLGSGILKAGTGAVDTVLQEAQNDLETGAKRDQNWYLNNGLLTIGSTLSPGLSYMVKNTAKQFDKEYQKKNFVEKVLDNINDLKEATMPSGLKEAVKTYGSFDKQYLGGQAPKNVENLSNAINKPSEDFSKSLDEEGKRYSGLVNFIGGGIEQVGHMVPSIATTALTKDPNLGLAALGISARGSSTREALKKGTDLDTAIKIGNAKALTEVATEKMFGGINMFGKKLFGPGVADNVVEGLVNKGIKQPLLNFLVKQGLAVGEETIEELVSNVVDNTIDKFTTDPNKKVFDVNETLETIKQTALTTILLNLFGGGYSPNAYNQNINNMREARGINQQVNNLNEQLKSQQQVTKGDVLDEVRSDASLDNGVDTTDIPQIVESKPVNTNTNQTVNVTQEANNTTNTENGQNVAEEMQREPVLRTNSPQMQDAIQKVKDGTATQKERSFIKTAVEAQNTEELIKDMDETSKTYEVWANEKSTEQAENMLKNYETLEDKAKYIDDLFNSGKKINAADLTAAELVLKEAAAARNSKVYTQILADTAILGTDYGQTIQAMNKIKELNPLHQLDVLEKIVNREKARGNQIYKNVEITEDMRNRVYDCFDENGMIDQEKFDNTMDEIKQELANEMPSTLSERARGWRYLSMLGNPKTHVRNVVANVAMYEVKGLKDKINAAGQDFLIRDKKNKTKTLKSSSNEVKQLAKDYAKEIYKGQENSKYNEQNELENKRQIFKNKGIEAWSKFNEKALSVEDEFFKKAQFKKSFANYLTAQGIETAQDIQDNPSIIQKAKEFAINEANVATFNQRNKLSEFVNSADVKLGTPGKVIRGAIAPFTRTTFNIAKTAIEYTPGTGLITTINDVKNAPKSMKGTVLIDGLSKQITGSSLAMVGYALAKAGIVTAKSDNDKEEYFKKDKGSKMDYSIKIGDTSYDLSWLAPSAMPFFIGARIFEILDKQEGFNENIILESLASTLDPLSEMSIISSFTDVLNSYAKSGTGQLKDMGISTMQNYLSQFIPTVVGQFARLFDDTKRNTAADNNSPNKVTQETIRKLQYKIPGLRNLLPASTDYYGKDKKEYDYGKVKIPFTDISISEPYSVLFSPVNKKKDTLSKEDKEILRVYESTGNEDIIPTSLQKYITFDKQRYDMSNKEYNEYKKTFGDTFTEKIKELMKKDEYKDATDEQKEKLIQKILTYSRDKAKDVFLTDRGVKYYTITKTGKKSYRESRKVENKVGEYGIVDYYLSQVLKEDD